MTPTTPAETNSMRRDGHATTTRTITSSTLTSEESPMRSTYIRIGILIGASLAITACTSERPQEPPSAGVDTGAANVVSGYAHAFSRSTFHIGSDTTQMRAGNVDKFVGSEGTFAVNRINGAV